MLKLKLRYFGYLMQRADLLEKTMMLGKIKGRRRREWQRLKWLDSITDSIDLSLSKLWEVVKDREAWHAVVHRVTELDMTERLNNSNIMYYSCEIIVEVHFFFFTNGSPVLPIPLVEKTVFSHELSGNLY